MPSQDRKQEDSDTYCRSSIDELQQHADDYLSLLQVRETVWTFRGGDDERITGYVRGRCHQEQHAYGCCSLSLGGHGHGLSRGSCPLRAVQSAWLTDDAWTRIRVSPSRASGLSTPEVRARPVDRTSVGRRLHLRSVRPGPLGPVSRCLQYASSPSIGGQRRRV